VVRAEHGEVGGIIRPLVTSGYNVMHIDNLGEAAQHTATRIVGKCNCTCGSPIVGPAVIRILTARDVWTGARRRLIKAERLMAGPRTEFATQRHMGFDAEVLAAVYAPERTPTSSSQLGMVA
jgi:hypothetical protein